MCVCGGRGRGEWKVGGVEGVGGGGRDLNVLKFQRRA